VVLEPTRISADALRAVDAGRKTSDKSPYVSRALRALQQATLVTSPTEDDIKKVLIPAAIAADAAAEAALRALADQEGCSGSNALCLREDGSCVDRGSGSTCGARVSSGQSLVVRVLGWPGLVAAGRVHVSFTVYARNESLTTPSAPTTFAAKLAPPPTDLGHIVALIQAAGAQSPALLATATSPAPAATDDFVRVVFSRDADPESATLPPALSPTATDDPAMATSAVRDVSVNPGTYYLDFGLMLPLTLDQSVVATPDISTGERTLSVRTDARIVPAFVINAYPGGRLRSRVSSFCNGPLHCAASWLGMQLGVGVGSPNHPPAGELYLGSLFTPISGLSFSSGLALVNQQIYPATYHDGAILPAGATLTPATHWYAEPYVGFSASLDLLTLILNAFQSVTTKK
jgi:hypothetical protein